MSIRLVALARRHSVPLLAFLFIGAGVAHLLDPAPYIRIVPPWIHAASLMVALSGVAEIAGGVGLLWVRTRRAAAIGLIVLLIAVFPANIQMLINAIHDHRPVWYQAALWIRLPLQPLLIWWAAKTSRPAIPAFSVPVGYDSGSPAHRPSIRAG